MQGKEEFFIKSTICNISIVAVNKYNILTKSTDSSGLIVVKLKRDLKILIILSQYTQMLYIRH